MSHKHPCLTASYQLNADEILQLSVPILNSYPDALNEAKAVAVAGLQKMLADVYAQTTVQRTPTVESE